MDRDEIDDPVPLDARPGARGLPSLGAWYNDHLAETETPDFPEMLVGPWSKLVAYAADWP